MRCAAIRYLMVAVLLAVSLPYRAEAAQPGIVVANTGGKQTAQFRDWQIFRKTVDDKSNGTLLLDYMIYGELGSAPAMLQAVKSGRATIGGFGCAGVTQEIPELAVLQMPYLFGDSDEFDFVLDRHMTAIFSQIMAQHGLVLLQWTDNGWMDFYSREPVQLPEQLNGKQVRTVNNIVGPLYLNSLKAKPVDVGIGELAAGSQADKIYGGLGALSGYARLQSSFKYLTLTQSEHNCGMVIANKAWFDSTTPHEQAVLRAAYPSLGDLKGQQDSADQSLLTEVANAGSVILKLTPTQRNAWAAAALPLYPAILQQAGARSVEVYDKVREGKKAYLHDPGTGGQH